MTADRCLVESVCDALNRNTEAVQAFISLYDLIVTASCDKDKASCHLRQRDFEMHALRLDIRKESSHTKCAQGHEYENNGLDVDHRLLPIYYRLRWTTRKKRMAPACDWSYIALSSARTDLVTSTRQFQE